MHIPHGTKQQLYCVVGCFLLFELPFTITAAINFICTYYVRFVFSGTAAVMSVFSIVFSSQIQFSVHRIFNLVPAFFSLSLSLFLLLSFLSIPFYRGTASSNAHTIKRSFFRISTRLAMIYTIINLKKKLSFVS